MRWKWVLGVLGFVIVVLIAVFYVIMVTYDFNKLKPKISGMAREATGRELTLGGDFKVAMGLSPSISVEGVNFQNAAWGSRPEMAKIKRLEIQIALFPLIWREIQFKRLILVEPEILVETDRSGRSNLEFKPGEKPKPEEKKGEEREGFPPLVFDEVQVEKGVLTYRDGKRDKTFSLKIDRLTAALPGGEKPTEVSLKGIWNGQPFEVQGTTGPLAALIAPDKPWPIKVTIKAGGATMTFEGSMKEALKGKGLDLTINGEGPSVRKVAELGGAPSFPDLGAFKLSGRITDPAGKVNVSNLKVLLGDSDLAGSVDLNLSGNRPQVTANLSSQKLDLRPFFLKTDGNAPEPRGPAKPAAKKEKVFPPEPLPLEWLKAVEARIKMQAGRLQIPGLAVTNLDTDILLENGNLTAKPFRLILSGGAFNGFFNVHSQENPSSFTLNLKVDKLDVGSLLKDLGTKQILEGKMDAEIDLRGRGRSIAEWMAGLNGRTLLVMGQGRLGNKYLDFLGADLAQSLLRLINPVHKGDDYTTLNCLVNGFDFKNGLAVCSALVLDTNVMSVVGAGEVNLKDEKLDLSLHPSPKKGLGTDTLGRISLSLGELTKAFKLGGTLAHPSLGIDPKQTLTTIGKAAGGMALFGPAGILAALESPTPQDPNPCLTAVERAKKGGKAEKKAPEGGKVPEEVKEGVEGLGKELKKLLGK